MPDWELDISYWYAKEVFIYDLDVLINIIDSGNVLCVVPLTLSDAKSCLPRKLNYIAANSTEAI